MPGGWFLPTLGYVIPLALLGITTRYALRQTTWQGLVLFSAIGYVIVLLALAAIRGFPFRARGPGSNPTLDWAMTAVGAFLPSLALVFLFIALERGAASRVIPVSSSYPLLTVVLAAIFLSEAVTWQVGVGALLVVGGVVLLSL